MVNAGRVLIIPKGTWSNLQNYEMLDLVSLDGVAYLARAASVGQNPSTDTSMTYWQPFGTASEIATTSKPGLVMPDGQTITIDATGLIQANLGISDLNNVTITSIANGQILVYDSTAGAWKNANLSVSAGDVNYNNQTSGLVATKVQGAIDEVSSQMQTLESNIDDLTTSVSTKADQSLLAPIQTTLVASKPYAIGEQFVYQGLLYKVTTAIAQGGTITINGNCELTDDVTTQIKGQTIYDNDVSIAAGAGWTDLPIDYSELEKYSRVIISCPIGPSNSGGQLGSLVLTKKDVDYVKTNVAYVLINAIYSNGIWYSVQFAVRSNSSTQKVSLICLVSGYSGWVMHHVNITGIG